MVVKNPTTLGERVRFYRHSQGLSIQALADTSGLHRNHLSLIEMDQTQMTIPKLRQLATALGVSCAHLLGEVGLLEDFEPLVSSSPQQTAMPEDHAHASIIDRGNKNE